MNGEQKFRKIVLTIQLVGLSKSSIDTFNFGIALSII